MLLKDATSKEQVEQALEDGDDELREDIEEQLDVAMRWWDRGGINDHLYDDDEEPDFRSLIEDERLVDAVISQSPSEYDLTTVPRELVEKNLRWTATHETKTRRGTLWGPFSVSENGGRGFDYKVETYRSATFPEHELPENSEFIPADMAEDFWGRLDGGVAWEQTSVVEENHGTADGDPYFIAATEEGFDEWCRDIVSEHVQALVKEDPAAAKELFFSVLSQENAGLGAKMKLAELPDEEILDFAIKWFESKNDKEEVIETIRDYFESMESGVDEPREVIGEWTQADLRAMGITKGPLYEEAPWKLIKLHPADLRLEGALMRHCVGDGGMGYTKAVSDGLVEIWSLRSQKNKPRFTLEVDESFYSADDSGNEPGMTKEALRTLTPAFFRGRAIKQLKGKANRTAGYADKHSSEIKFPDEIQFWLNVFEELGVDADQVDDFSTNLNAYLNAHARSLRPNRPKFFNESNHGPDQCIGFDAPYRQLRLR